MGYFSNGSEGMDYEARYCDKCVHQEAGCAVWLAHMMHNYDECNKKDSILHILIPRSEDGWNQQCKMFHPDKATKEEMKRAEIELEKYQKQMALKLANAEDALAQERESRFKPYH